MAVTAPKRVTRGFAFDAPARQKPARRQARPKRRPPEQVAREKRAKFKEIITPRVNKTLHNISLLTFGANRKRYDYTEKDVELMREALHRQVDDALAPYAPAPIKETANVEFID